MLAPLELVVCAAPSYLAAHAEPASIDELRLHSCLDFAALSTPNFWQFETHDGLRNVAVTGPVRANSGFALRSATLEGLGTL